MPGKKRIPRKNLTLDRFFGGDAGKVSPTTTSGGNRSNRESMIDKGLMHKSGESTRGSLSGRRRDSPIDGKPSFMNLLDLLGRSIQRLPNNASSSKDLTQQVINEKPPIIRETGLWGEGSEKKGLIKDLSIEDLGEAMVPEGEILDTILEKGLLTSDVYCNEFGECDDGINIGEFFIDEYGFHRQRGFVRTTRIPVFVDWVVEDALIKKLLPSAHKLVTNRGAVALVPDDFLCELQARYGVIIRNYDKCWNYKPSIISTSSGRRRK